MDFCSCPPPLPTSLSSCSSSSSSSLTLFLSHTPWLTLEKLSSLSLSGSVLRWLESLSSSPSIYEAFSRCQETAANFSSFSALCALSLALQLLHALLFCSPRVIPSHPLSSNPSPCSASTSRKPTWLQPCRTPVALTSGPRIASPAGDASHTGEIGSLSRDHFVSPSPGPSCTGFHHPPRMHQALGIT